MTRNLEMPERVLRVVISPLVDEIGTTAGAVGLFSDITQMGAAGAHAARLCGHVSHEMRTPLTAMRALIEPLKEGMVKTEDARMRYYDIILREIMRLSRLINDLMELSRLQSGTLAIRTERMKLAGLVGDVCERYRSIAEDHNITFREETDFSKVPAVVSNPDRVEQLLVILLDNAIKYTPGGGTVSLDAPRRDDARVTLIVKDTGIGISKEDLALCVRPPSTRWTRPTAAWAAVWGCPSPKNCSSGWARISGSRAKWARAHSLASRCAATHAVGPPPHCRRVSSIWLGTRRLRFGGGRLPDGRFGRKTRFFTKKV